MIGPFKVEQKRANARRGSFQIPKDGQAVADDPRTPFLPEKELKAAARQRDLKRRRDGLKTQSKFNTGDHTAARRSIV